MILAGTLNMELEAPASLDIDFTLEQLADAMTEKVEYDTYINGLDDEKYAKM